MTPGRLVLLGHPVTHSVSPRMHNAALQSAGIDIRYEALDAHPDNLSGVVRDLAKTNSAGNVTRPHKRALFALCDSMTDVATRSGAVNTFWFEDHRLHGDNTDVAGFERAVRLLVHDRYEGPISLFGSGGAAAGVLEALSSWAGVTVDLIARNRLAGAELASRYPGFVHHVEMTRERLHEAKLVINATPVGQDDESVPFDVNELHTSAKVFDLVYRRGGTLLVRLARAAGLEADDGTAMLVEQGALSFERWFGFPPDRKAMQLAIA
ncbi:MAG: shikimate dehydrogenase [Gemmatimonadaceae bacterium]|nr:shikimate dehydrogenase [Gemmatimonadaceae bacterium]